jgi:hypothetical protein
MGMMTTKRIEIIFPPFLLSGRSGFSDRRDRRVSIFFFRISNRRGFNIAQLSPNDFFHFYQFCDITLVAVGPHLQDRFDV